jgi:hypothetical protein
MEFVFWCAVAGVCIAWFVRLLSADIRSDARREHRNSLKVSRKEFLH